MWADMTNLPFAEAMALDPSDVEYTAYGLRWDSLATFDNHRWTWNELKLLRFRRARPRRSRVQEMAENFANGAGEQYMIVIIRAVCEYLRTACQHGEDSSAEYAKVIEREFLEER